MDSSCSLPFDVGQLAESKSFQHGFRGAWFRCKIHDMNRKKGRVSYALEFYDYPDEKIKWLNLYQRPHIGPTKRRKELKLQLMLRPPFPPQYRENEVSSLDSISEVVVIVRDFWKVGDMVDWFCEGCFWSGRITRILEEDKLQVELLPPPEGEGKSYDVPSSALRPSLHWSPELGWIVPLPKGRGSSLCARLVHPQKRDERGIELTLPAKRDAISCETESSISSNRLLSSFPLPKGALDIEDNKEKDRLVEDDQVDLNVKSDASISSTVSPGLLLPLTRSSHSGMASPRQILEHTGHGIEIEVSSCPMVTRDGDAQAARKNSKEMSGSGCGNRQNSALSCSYEVMDSSITGNVKSLQEGICSSGFTTKKARLGRIGHLNSAMHADSVESSIVEIEELANKMRWLRGLLKFGAHYSDVKKPTWKFHEAS